MPIGEEINGRLFNVIGDAIDGMPNLPKNKEKGLPIHRPAPAFEELSTSTEVLFTGIKVIDLIEPYAKGGKIGSYRLRTEFKGFYVEVAKSFSTLCKNFLCALSCLSCRSPPGRKPGDRSMAVCAVSVIVYVPLEEYT